MAEALAETRDPRLRAAWKSWLAALATDADAALAASFAYESLAPELRGAWLDALDQDAPSLAVPAVALYAPLAAVEQDPALQTRIAQALASARPLSPASVRAFCGISPEGPRVCVLVAPLYLDFVELLRCRYCFQQGILEARLEPMCRLQGSPVSSVPLEETPLAYVLDDLAQAVIVSQRNGRTLPPALCDFAYLFGPQQGS